MRFCFLLILFLSNCTQSIDPKGNAAKYGLELLVLGSAQDAGFPQMNCYRNCCKEAQGDLSKEIWVSCLGVIDHENKSYYIFDATPDFDKQNDHVKSTYPDYKLSGIFLTHAHIGHYTGLMYLGREVIGAKQIPVYVMPRMEYFLMHNGPWIQLYKLGNIDLIPMKADSSIRINALSVTPFLVPHRDEFSETVGFKIQGPSKSALFIPDIDKWHLWDRSIVQEVEQVDFAFLDATFYEEAELPGRNMSEIPQPFVPETMDLFQSSSHGIKEKIHFIHLNHSNPLLDKESNAYQLTKEAGYHIASTFDMHRL